MLILLLACSEPESASGPGTNPANTPPGPALTGGSPGDPSANPGANNPGANAPGANAPGQPGAGNPGGPEGTALEEGPWSIRNKEGGDVVGAMLTVCPKVDPLDGRCVSDTGAGLFAWQEIPVANSVGGKSKFYWPNETKGQESWYVSVPKNAAAKPPDIKWKDTYGFAEDPKLEFKGIDTEVSGGAGFAEPKDHFRPLGPFAAPTDQTWAYAGGYLGNEKDSCFEVVSKTGDKEAKGFLSVDYPDKADGTVTETLCAPAGFGWASTKTGTSLTITYTKAGACECPEGSSKYGYKHKYK